MKACRLFLVLVVLSAMPLLATTFIMPTDDEMILKSQRIVIGSVQSAYVRESDGALHTVYDFRVERTLKGAATPGGTSIRIVSPGGALEDRGVVVHGAAHFAIGERVLLFLTRSQSEWTPVDLTLGKFRFVMSSKGDRLLTRDLEDVGVWERDGTRHMEKVRREDGFLQFIEDRVAGRRTKSEEQADYLVAASSVILPPAPESGVLRIRADDGYTPESYTGRVTCGPPFCSPQIGPFPTRWNVFPNPVQYFKKADQNIAGAVDGGVGTIQNGLAAWTNDCGSNAVLTYGGTTNTASADFDGVNVVEFNDPQGRIAGSFGGGGTVAVAFSSFAGTHSFLSQTWWTYTSADIVFQDGFTAANAAFATAMSHEIGHTIGWRHSNAAPATGNDQTISCSAATEECTSTNTAIMFWQAGTTFNFTLQPWDINAVRGVYPTACITVDPPTAVVATGSLTGGSVTVSWTNSGTATSYNVYRSTDNVNFTKISTDGTVTTTPFVDNTATTGTAYMYRVRGVASAVESADSNKDFAVPMSYTDPTITASSTPVKAAHFTQLTTATNGLRTMAGLGAVNFSEGTPASSGAIRRSHVIELRTAIDAARVALGFSAGSYTTDGTITIGVTTIKKNVVDELRTALR